MNKSGLRSVQEKVKTGLHSQYAGEGTRGKDV